MFCSLNLTCIYAMGIVLCCGTGDNDGVMDHDMMTRVTPRSWGDCNGGMSVDDNGMLGFVWFDETLLTTSGYGMVFKEILLRIFTFIKSLVRGMLHVKSLPLTLCCYLLAWD